MKKILCLHETHQVVVIILSSVFLIAGSMKIIDSDQFIFNLTQYQLFSMLIIHPLAIGVPWLEVVIGLAILLPQFKKAAVLIMTIMTIVFMGAIGSALLRGLDISCGCFGQISNHVGFILLDVLILFFTSVLLCCRVKS